MKLPCWLWFLVFLGFGLLLLLLMIHLPDLSDTEQQQNSGVLVLVAPRWPVEKDSPTAQQSSDIDAGRFLGSLPSLHLQRQSITSCSDPFLNSKHQVTQGHRKLLKTFPSGGERALQQSRRRLLNYVCSRYRPVIGKQQMTRQVIRKQLTKQWLTRKQLSRIYVEDQFRLLYCEVPKAGCSNWKRVLMVLGGSADSVWNIPHDAAHYANHLRRLENYDPAGVAERLLSYTKVLFVREPFERLVSAFRDKFENPNSYYHHVFGRAIISRYRVNASRRALSTGTGVTFREFVQYLLDPKRPIGMDIHWEPVSQLCSPCLFRYHFIGKFESLEKDANFLLRHIGAPANLTFPDFKDRNPHAERTSSRISQNYFSKLNATERQKVFEFYLRDYQMFSYPKPVSHLH